MKHKYLLILLLGIAHNLYSNDIFKYLEHDGDSSQILHEITCAEFNSKTYCNYHAVTIRNFKNKNFPCSVSIDNVFEIQEATKEKSGSYVVSKSGKLCNYTSSYVFSKAGMVETKTTPDKIPKGMEKICSTHAPKVYNIKAIDSFNNIPYENCQAISLLWYR